MYATASPWLRPLAGTGELNFDFLFAQLDRLGYAGWIGCEYKPAATTTAGLGWLQCAVAGAQLGAERAASPVNGLPKAA